MSAIYLISIALVLLAILQRAVAMDATKIAPPRTWVVDQQSLTAADDNPGTAERPFKSIAPAAALAQPGDTVLVHAGIYRECITPARGGEPGKPITYAAAPGATVIVTASDPFVADWQPLAGHDRVFHAPLDPSLFKNFNPFTVQIRQSRGGGKQGQVFCNDARLREVLTLNDLQKTPGSWMSAYGKDLLVHLPEGVTSPDKASWEISTRRRCFVPVRRGTGHLIVRGFTFQNAANDVSLPQVGMVSTRSGHDWIIEDNVIRNSKTVGLDCGKEGGRVMLPDDTHPDDRAIDFSGMRAPGGATWPVAGGHVIRRNRIVGNGQCGIAGLDSAGTVVSDNVVEDNAKLIPGFESAGIKFHGLLIGRVERNLVRHNGSFGIWLDCGYINSRVSRNIVLHTDGPGIFMELSGGPALIDNNISAFNRDDGLFMHDAAGVTAAHNLLYANGHFGFWAHVATDRQWSTYPAFTGIDNAEQNACRDNHVLNNLIVASKKGEVSFPLDAPRSHDNFSDANVYAPRDRAAAFSINFKNGNTSGIADLDDAARLAFILTGDPNTPADELAKLKENVPLIDLAKWREATKRDASSRTDVPVSVEIVEHADGRIMLTLQFDATLNLGTPVEGVTSDFTGAVRDAKGVVPGPLVSPGTVQIWPVPADAK
jgi:parallel beta-helix repeat protein